MFWRKKALTPAQLLVNAIATRDLDQARRLLDAGASANARDAAGIPVLGIAASTQWLEAVQVLLEHGADPNIVINAPDRGLNEVPVLNLPAANGSPAVLRALIAAGASLSARDATGLTALMSAAHQGHLDVVDELIGCTAALEQTDELGYTALMFASNAGRLDAVRRLLEAGANPNAVDHEGSTPIMFAAQHAHDAVVEALLGAGADPHAVGMHGLSAIGFARQNDHETTLRILLRGGA